MESVTARRRNTRSEGLPGADELVAILKRAGRPLKPKEIARAANVGGQRYRALRQRLRELAVEGTLYRVRNGRYAIPARAGLVIGQVEVLRSGAAFVTPEVGTGDIHVAEAALGGAMDGDRVAVRIEARPSGKRPSGRVVKVLERAHRRLVGRFGHDGRLGFVAPMGVRFRRSILVPDELEQGASEGDVVVVTIDSYGDRRLPPVGRVSEVLGKDDDPAVDSLIVMYEHDLPLAFSADVTQAARASVSGPDPWTDRVDRRDLYVFTIDPADAKDHDDALSVHAAEGGGWEVGIHIADVSRFVPAGSPTDLEAMDRGTSVYLVDRVVPMLPPLLSGDACSLEEHRDRPTLSVFVQMDDEGAVRNHRIERTTIRSRASLSYDQAQSVLDGAEAGEAPELSHSLGILGQLAAILRQRRLKKGALDFDLPEPIVILDPTGAATEILKAPRFASHMLVEEFMLLANNIVARTLETAGLDPIYRIHDRPSQERMDELRHFLSPLGYSLPRQPSSSDLSAVLERAEGRPEEPVVVNATLRALKRARYDVDNVGHFGLAMEEYLHFTSPIRRYPDLVTHRLVVEWLAASASGDAADAEELDAVARHASHRERRAARAEQDSVQLARLRLMEGRLGDVLTGTVSKTASFGLFVIPDDVFVEGLVHVRSLTDDYYEHDERRMALVGRSRGRTFKVGQRISVQVAKVDRDRREIDFVVSSHQPRVGE